jgi:hypothetical protein
MVNFTIDNTLTCTFAAPFLPVYSFFIALWSVCMLELWKRKEKTTALEWGTINYEAQELDRPGNFFHRSIRHMGVSTGNLC